MINNTVASTKMISKKSSIKRAETQIELFFSNCSIRGVSKAYRSRSTMVRLIWILFIVLMMTLLLYSVIKILREYLEYNTTIQTRLQFDEPSQFPSMTICPFQPFSDRAVDYFDQGGVSPFKFSQNLRKWAKYYLERNQPQMAERLMVYDKLRVYYQNLPQNDSFRIGLNKHEMLVFCITKFKFFTLLGEADQNCGFDILQYSTPDFFNCFTVQLRQRHQFTVQYIRLILRFPRVSEQLRRHQEIALLNSLSQNIIGAQIVVHESGKMPTSIQEKIYIEPNRLLQINYRNNQWKEYNTPQDICLNDNHQGQKIRDLDNEYTYTFAECVKQYAAKAVLNRCGCIVAYMPRPVMPTRSTPYCGAMPWDLDESGIKILNKRVRCIIEVVHEVDQLSPRFKNCYRRCEEQKFDLQISTINWKASNFQLEWLYRLNSAWNILIEGPALNTSSLQFSSQSSPQVSRDPATVQREVIRFLEAQNDSDLVQISRERSLFSASEDYACIVLERMSNDTFFKQEKLGLSLYGLVSRVGGSCTLYLGLTCAFFIEVLELIIEKIQTPRQRRQHQHRRGYSLDNNRRNFNRSHNYNEKISVVHDNVIVITAPPLTPNSDAHSSDYAGEYDASESRTNFVEGTEL